MTTFSHVRNPSATPKAAHQTTNSANDITLDDTISVINDKEAIQL